MQHPTLREQWRWVLQHTRWSDAGWSLAASVVSGLLSVILLPDTNSAAAAATIAVGTGVAMMLVRLIGNIARAPYYIVLEQRDAAREEVVALKVQSPSVSREAIERLAEFRGHGETLIREIGQTTPAECKRLEQEWTAPIMEHLASHFSIADRNHFEFPGQLSQGRYVANKLQDDAIKRTYRRMAILEAIIAQASRGPSSPALPPSSTHGPSSPPPSPG